MWTVLTAEGKGFSGSKLGVLAFSGIELHFVYEKRYIRIYVYIHIYACISFVWKKEIYQSWTFYYVCSISGASLNFKSA